MTKKATCDGPVKHFNISMSTASTIILENSQLGTSKYDYEVLYCNPMRFADGNDNDCSMSPLQWILYLTNLLYGLIIIKNKKYNKNNTIIFNR